MNKNYMLTSAANGIIANPLYFSTLDEARLAMEHDVAETVEEGWEKKVGETEAYAKSNTGDQVYSWRIFELPKRNEISIPTPLGNLKAVIGGDPDYHEIFTFIERLDGVEIDLISAEVRRIDEPDIDEAAVRAYIYSDTDKDSYVDTCEWTKEAINIDLENNQEVTA